MWLLVHRLDRYNRVTGDPGQFNSRRSLPTPPNAAPHMRARTLLEQFQQALHTVALYQKEPPQNWILKRKLPGVVMYPSSAVLRVLESFSELGFEYGYTQTRKTLNVFGVTSDSGCIDDMAVQSTF